MPAPSHKPNPDHPFLGDNLLYELVCFLIHRRHYIPHAIDYVEWTHPRYFHQN